MKLVKGRNKGRNREKLGFKPGLVSNRTIEEEDVDLSKQEFIRNFNVDEVYNNIIKLVQDRFLKYRVWSSSNSYLIKAYEEKFNRKLKLLLENEKDKEFLYLILQSPDNFFALVRDGVLYEVDIENEIVINEFRYSDFYVSCPHDFDEV